MALDLTAFDSVLKDVYITGKVRDQLNEETNLLKAFTKSDVNRFDFDGRRVIVPLHKGRNVGVKYTAENASLPVAGSQTYANLAVQMKKVNGRIQLSIESMKFSDTNKGAFEAALELELRGMVSDIARQRNRALAYFGQGTLALINGSVASATQDVDAPGNVAGANNGTRFLKPGMVIAVHDAAAPATTIDAVRTVSSITDHNTVVFDATVTPDDNAPLTIGFAGSPNEGSYNGEAMGILGLADSTTFVTTIHGLDRSLAANSFFRSIIESSVGALSEDVLYRGIGNGYEVSGKRIDQLWCHFTVQREVIKLHQADRRYSGVDLRKGDAGAEAGLPTGEPAFGGIPVRMDKDFAYRTIVGLRKDVLLWLPAVEGEWADEDESVLGRVSTTDAYEARYRVIENFAAEQGNCLVRWDGVTATESLGIFAD